MTSTPTAPTIRNIQMTTTKTFPCFVSPVPFPVIFQVPSLFSSTSSSFLHPHLKSTRCHHPHQLYNSNTLRSRVSAGIIPSTSSLEQTDPPTISTKTTAQYVPLHVHSDFSLLDGASQLPSLVSRAEELGVPALALTDHGVLYGAIQLVRLCSNTSVKPIIGNEMYLVNHELPYDNQTKLKKYHLIVLAKNTIGYKNLVKLTTMSHLNGKVGKGIFSRPCINKSQLYKHREGLIVSSACLGGEIPQAILNDDIKSAFQVAKWYHDIFGNDFYLEIQDHGSKEDKKVNPVLVDISEQLGIDLIATNDSHFTNCLDAEAHDAMICIQTGKKLSDDNRLHYSGREYFKSFDEMKLCFIDHLPEDVIDRALENTLKIATKIDKYDLFGNTRIPDFPIPPSFSTTTQENTHDIYLRHVSKQGLHERLKSRIQSGLIADVNDVKERYEKRLDEEVEMICRMGFSSYFLVVWDYIKHARELQIPVGPGRGSAAGSLVAFALRITDVDPLPFNLLFERFLNPERKSMPDIDTDFSVEGREHVINYVSQRYGYDKVAQIITFNRLTSKAVLKDVARVHEVAYSEADRLAKLIPVIRGKPATLSQLLSSDKKDQQVTRDFKNLVDKHPEYMEWIEKARRIEGANKTFGIHAAGVVISASPLTDIVPLSKAKHGETITQYAMEDVEALGLLKMDFLGLKNLSVIEKTLQFINEGRILNGEDLLNFSVDELPLNDTKTYQLLSEGELDGIFQLDASGGMRSIVRELRPSSLEDISSILALYRPGPLDAGLIPKFIRRKHGIEPIEYDHPILKPILEETYGIMVYQEQIMRIARDLAGYTLGQADILRRAMGKKKVADMEKEKPKFIQGCVRTNNVNEKLATDLFDQMVNFAEYCFNKSHSTAYAYLTYQTAYLKANYTVEYCAALLRCNMNVSDKLVRYLSDANVQGVTVLPPCINRSDLGFTVDRSRKEKNEGVVLFGLEAVKTVGETVGEALIEERNVGGHFESIIDLIERVDMKVLNKRAMGSLIQAGAFDEIHVNRKILLGYLDEMLILRRKLRDKRRRKELKLSKANEKGNEKDIEKVLEEIEKLKEEEIIVWDEMKFKLQVDSIEQNDFTEMERLAGEKSTMGFYASGHPLYEVQHVGKILDCTSVINIIGDVGNVDHTVDGDGLINSSGVEDGTEVMVLSCVTELKKLTTARGKKMGKWMIEDTTSRMQAIVFPESYALLEQQLVAVKSEEGEEEEPKYVVEEDARVIVWGKVDRESSGSVQIIVDDVQRVEDVNVMIVSAPFDEDRTRDFQTHIVQHMAARLLEVDLNNLDSSSTFMDPNGMRRRRRKKYVVLNEKNRVPLIMECLNRDGKSDVDRYVNVGNSIRFPIECAAYVPPLQKNTGFQCRLLNVGKDIMNGQGIIMMEKTEDKEEIVLNDNNNDDNEALHQSAEEEGELLSSTEEMESSPLPLSSSLKMPSEDGEELEIGKDKTAEMYADEALKILNVSEEKVLAMTESWDDELRENMARQITSEREADKDNQSESKVSLTSTYLDPTMTRFFSKTHNINKLARHEAFCNLNDDDEELQRGSEQPQEQCEYGKRNVSVVTAPPPEVKTKSMKSTIVNGGGLEVARRRSGVAEGGGREGIERNGMNGGLPRRVTKRDAALNANGFNGFNGLNRSGDDKETTKELDAVDVVAEEMVRAVEENEAKETNVNVIGRMVDVKVGEIKNDDDDDVNGVYVNDNISSVDSEIDIMINNSITSTIETHSVSTQQHQPLEQQIVDNRMRSATSSTTPTSDTNNMSASITSPNLNFSEGMTLKFDEVKMSGLLDAIALVCNNVARRHNNIRDAEYTIRAMCGLEMETLDESGISLHVSGSIAYCDSESSEIYMIVEIRETEASGKRKRVRSFGPVAAIVQCSNGVVEEFEVKTKKGKKRVETFTQKAEQTHSNLTQFDIDTSATGIEEEVEVKRKSKKRNKRNEIVKEVRGSEVGFASMFEFDDHNEFSLMDGGEVIGYMCRSAEVCARRCIDNEEESTLVTSLEWLCCNESKLSINGKVKQIELKTELIGVSFDVMKICVQAEIVIKVGEGKEEVEDRKSMIGYFGAKSWDQLDQNKEDKEKKRIRLIADLNEQVSEGKENERMTQLLTRILKIK